MPLVLSDSPLDERCHEGYIPLVLPDKLTSLKQIGVFSRNEIVVTLEIISRGNFEPTIG